MNIIIVEDEIRIREGIQRLIAKWGNEYQLIGEAEDGLSGLNLIRELHPDIVITDIRMPNMDGLQMLQQMKEEQIGAKAIVLSAYSEFEYARRAMKLGVTEYLLKPISYNDFLQSLTNVKLQVEKERQIKPAEIGTLEQIFQDVISGGMNLNPEIMDYLEHNYDIKKEDAFVLLCVYLGNDYENNRESVKKYFKHAFSIYHPLSYCILEASYRSCLLITLYHYKDEHDLERWVQSQILENAVDRVSIGWVEVNQIAELKRGFDDLYPYMDWNLALDDTILISYPKITHIQTVPCIYPFDIERRLKVALCEFNWNKINGLMREFHEEMLKGKIFAPREIKECYVRFLWAAISLAKEIGVLKEAEVDQQELISKIMNAKLKEELVDTATVLLKNIRFEQTEEENMHLTVKRAKSMMHEFYQTGITLDEIAMKLNLTPEYLGTLFHKETGVTFSNYMKNYRIGKAKQLLCGTELKLYEIAEQSGYTDPKYFSKVFREVTGQLPTEYRKTFK